jgi:hypothetical protein
MPMRSLRRSDVFSRNEHSTALLLQFLLSIHCSMLLCYNTGVTVLTVTPLPLWP